MGQGSDVLVLDANGHFAEYVKPAVARRAMKSGVVSVDSVDPLILRMPTGMRRVPRLFKGRGVKNVQSLDKFGDLFKEEQPLWVKTLVPGQVSIEIPIAPGMTVPVRVPANGDPVCLTDVADFASLKRCADLRKLASPRKVGERGLKPPAIAILTEAQMREHLEKKAIRRGWVNEDGSPDVERALQPTYTEEAFTQPAAQIDLPESKTREMMDDHHGDANLGNDGQVQLVDIVHPRVLSLCNEVSASDVAENQRMPADAILDELESLGALNEETLNHVLSFGYYKSVKNWAMTQLKERAPGEED